MCVAPPTEDFVRAAAVLNIQEDTSSAQSTSGSESEDEEQIVGAAPSMNPAADETPMHQCRYQCPPCTQPRGTRPNGTLHEFCDGHRRRAAHIQRRQQQRDRLLRVLVNALQPQAEHAEEPGQQRRRRPRLVLLGNQGTLILGVVLSDRGDLHELQGTMPST